MVTNVNIPPMGKKRQYDGKLQNFNIIYGQQKLEYFNNNNFIDNVNI